EAQAYARHGPPEMIEGLGARDITGGGIRGLRGRARGISRALPYHLSRLLTQACPTPGQRLTTPARSWWPCVEHSHSSLESRSSGSSRRSSWRPRVLTILPTTTPPRPTPSSPPPPSR